ncbi:glycosyltransferase family 4 protein [uncultured Castellaniella sp.]|uniref:glycosyltransferase family 4 protein n=1 Tax=uncultured Castellaniella sp. TaxID=647907 RepID=UPI00261BCD57|nr:glycosyltransferase family 4 protein [uncultured Castellaniella sp.]
MKIIYLHQYFNTPEMSGSTRSYEMAKRMVRRGHTVEMITARTDGLSGRNGWFVEDVDGIKVHWLNVRYDNSMGIVRRLIAFLLFSFRASIYASRLQGDVVLASSTPLTISIPGVRVSRKLKAPLVLEVRDLWPEVPIAMGALRLPGSIFCARRLEAWAYRCAKRIIALSPDMRKGVIATGVPQDKVVCIPNSADVELFQGDGAAGGRFRAEQSWLGDKPLVLYAGTFGRVNGVDFMVHMAAAMRQLNPDVRFLAVGGGAKFGEVRELASDLGVLNENFFMERAVSKARVVELFAAATVCCSWVVGLEPLWKNSANKLFDAMAAGKPVVINYRGWQKDLIDQEGIGLVVPVDDADLAARMLDSFLSDEIGLKKAGEAAFSLGKARFSRDMLAAEMIEVLERAAQSS